jgi:hypothetical protein
LLFHLLLLFLLAVLAIKPRTLHMLGKCSTTEFYLFFSCFFSYSSFSFFSSPFFGGMGWYGLRQGLAT